MRRLSLLLLLTACDLQPGKPKPAPSEPAAAATPADAGTEPVPSPFPNDTVDAGIKAAPPKASEECVTVGAHITKTLIASMTDPTQKAAQEADQANMIKRIAETCTKDKWSEKSRTCFLNAKSASELEPCGSDLAAPE